MPLNITIIGLDVLGGSLGLALGTLDAAVLPAGRPVITGWDAQSRAVRDARDRLMIDRPAGNLVEAVADADVVFVSATPDQLVDIFQQIAPRLKHGAIVTDVGSTKGAVLSAAQRTLPTTVDFIGGNPIVPRTGTLRDAAIEFFKGSIYCLVPGSTARPQAIDTVAALVEAIGAKPYYIDAAEHDAYVASVQHLPLIMSAALIESVSRSGGWREIQPIAGESFRLTTQMAGTDPSVSSAICASNSTAIAGRIDELIRLLSEVRDNLRNPEQIEALFAHARDVHLELQAAQPNMRPGENDYYGIAQEPPPSRGLSAMFFGQRKRPDRGRK